MKQEKKDLLLRDLCARYPYGVICYNSDTETNFKLEDIAYIDFPTFNWRFAGIESVKPYLRPMSSMTDEEKIELSKITNSLIGYDEDSETVKSLDFYGDARLDAGMEIWLKVFDWLNKKMFAYCTYDGKDMFELGLAIVAPEGMYDDK